MEFIPTKIIGLIIPLHTLAVIIGIHAFYTLTTNTIERIRSGVMNLFMLFLWLFVSFFTILLVSSTWDEFLNILLNDNPFYLYIANLLWTVGYIGSTISFMGIAFLVIFKRFGLHITIYENPRKRKK